MKVKEILTEGLGKKDTYPILLDFIRFAAKHLYWQHFYQYMECSKNKPHVFGQT